MPRRSLDDLDKKVWKQMKKEAGIKSAPWFKKADASVGKFVEAAKKARLRYQDGKLAEDLLKYQDALENLAAAFEDFVSNKGLNSIEDDKLEFSEKKVLLNDIKDWQAEIKEVLEKLKKALLKYSKAINTNEEAFKNAEASKKLEVWKKLGFDPLEDMI